MVEKTGKRDCQRKPEHVPQKCTGSGGCDAADPERNIASDQAKRKWCKADNPVNEIQDDCIRSDPYERRGPGFPPPDIDELVRDGKEDNTVTPDNQYE